MKLIKILIFGLFFVLVFGLTSKASAIDESQPGYYGYKSRKIISEALLKHSEIPEEKRVAIIDMLSKDGYFWMKTKEQKLNYIHAKLSVCKYLSIVADVENVHSWTVQPTNSTTFSYGASNASAGLKPANKQFEKGSVDIYGVKFVFEGWPAKKYYELDSSAFTSIADRIIWLRKKVSKLTSEKPYKSAVFFPDPIVEEVRLKTGWQANVYTVDQNKLWIGFPISETFLEMPTIIRRVVDHEFGHMLHFGTYLFVGDTNNKELVVEFLKKTENARIPVFNANWGEIYNGYMERTDFRRYLSFSTLLGEHPWSNEHELFATTFEEEYLTQHDKVIKNPPKIDTQIKSNETQNLIIFAWESMATLIDGDDASQHPFLHKPITKNYTLKEIYEGQFWND